eukprot:CAMPEP_0170484700 /NCGR_PEP_ID=MMETSP0208-20121228/4105_1 /TAXON_ID=197538 /ORGANISM="Strombidium inclinatum, Strain S3" /LENGTH=134 /DNA_ID=CAMNT_0010758093 /DNA_START=8 /DNA_END=412 /DNA_ORIENTATION=-
MSYSPPNLQFMEASPDHQNCLSPSSPVSSSSSELLSEQAPLFESCKPLIPENNLKMKFIDNIFSDEEKGIKMDKLDGMNSPPGLKVFKGPCPFSIMLQKKAAEPAALVESTGAQSKESEPLSYKRRLLKSRINN